MSFDEEIASLKSALSAEIAANTMLREALIHIRDMKPSELAPETFPGLVHGPRLLLDNCQRAARKALSASRSPFTARVMALEALSDKIKALRIATSNRAVGFAARGDVIYQGQHIAEELGKVCQALAALTPSAKADALDENATKRNLQK